MSLKEAIRQLQAAVGNLENQLRFKDAEQKENAAKLNDVLEKLTNKAAEAADWENKFSSLQQHLQAANVQAEKAQKLQADLSSLKDREAELL